MARKFLYVVAGLIVLVLAALLALRIWAEQLTELAFVPSADFSYRPALAAGAYAEMNLWIARPGLGESDPSRWTPPDFTEDADALGAAVFFVHPTSYFDKAAWNAPDADKKSRDLAELYVQGMASPFNKSVDIWAPRYRQATIGAFLTSQSEGGQALDLAYGDVREAFDFFIRTVDPDRPIVLAGHSQGAFHLRRLIHERVTGKPLARRLAAAYLIGWPISTEHDLPAMDLPGCERPDQAGCVVSWLSMAEPAETDMIIRTFQRQRGLDGKTLKEASILCVNPLTGTMGGEAPASANLGTLVPDIDGHSGTLVAGKVPAGCRDDGFLSIGPPPDLPLGPYVLPGNNYHVFDMTLFWANLRADVSQRVAAWRKAR